jgi:hypothetical protein
LVEGNAGIPSKEGLGGHGCLPCIVAACRVAAGRYIRFDDPHQTSLGQCGSSNFVIIDYKFYYDK